MTSVIDWSMPTSALLYTHTEMNILHGSVVTRLRCGGIANGRFIADLLMSEWANESVLKTANSYVMRLWELVCLLIIVECVDGVCVCVCRRNDDETLRLDDWGTVILSY